MTADVQISVESEGAATLIRLGGEIDLKTSPAVRACLDDLEGCVIVDLEDVTFLDSSGMGTFVSARKRLVAEGGALLLRGPQPPVHRALEATGLAAFLDPRAENHDGRSATS